MPKMTGHSMQSMTIPGAMNFQFSGVRPEQLGASEQTLVVVALDVSGSMSGYAGDLNKTMAAIVGACQQFPRADNVLLRLVTFNNQTGEVHGFMPVTGISAHAPFRPTGGTALFDAAYSAIGSVGAYGRALAGQDLAVNGIVFIVTDGEDNCSVATPTQIRLQVETLRRQESLESMLTILIGFGDDNKALRQFHQSAGFDQYVAAGAVTPDSLARMANFIARSITSQSWAMASHGQSQLLTF